MGKSEDYLEDLTNRTLWLKDKAVDFNSPKEKQKKAIRLWIESLQKLRKELGKFRLKMF